MTEYDDETEAGRMFNEEVAKGADFSDLRPTQNAQGELEAILPCSCGTNLGLNGSHYDDCARGAMPKVQALLLQAKAESLQDLHGWIERRHTPDLGSKDRWEVAAGEIQMEIEVRLNSLTKGTE